MSTQIIRSTFTLPDTEYHSESDETAEKCFLCYATIHEDEKPWQLFQTWEFLQGGIRPRAEIVSCILDMAMDENKAHSKFLCNKCNEIILDYERMRIKLYDLRNKIVTDFKKTIQQIDDLNQSELKKYEISDTEEDFHEFIEANAMKDYVVKEIQSKNDGERDVMVKSTQNVSTKIFLDPGRNEYITFNTIFSEDTENTQNKEKPGYNLGIGDGIVDKTYLPTDSFCKNSIQSSTTRNDCFSVAACKPVYLNEATESDEAIFYHLESLYGQYLCPLCFTNFPNFPELSTHLKENRVCGEPWESDKCLLLSTYYKRLYKHNLMKCLSKSEYTNHILKCDVKKSFVCSFCQKNFTTQRALNTHIKIHGERERRFQCEICKKGFFAKQALIEHKFVHTGSYPYVCSTCDKGFRRRKQLSNHKLLKCR